MPKISVIIPVYNVEKYLARCLDSVVRQTFNNLEIICVNDGSTDNSAKILKQYAKQDKRIKIITQKNGGLSAARNAGLKHMSGEYVSFIDSDDWIDIEYYEHLMFLLEQNNADVAMAGMRCVCGRDISENTTPNMVTNNFIEKIKNLPNGSVCDKLFKSALFDGIEFPIGRYYEDNIILVQIMHKSNIMVFSNYVSYYYFMNQSGICKTPNAAVLKQKDADRLYFAREILKFAHDNNCKNIDEIKAFLLRTVIDNFISKKSSHYADTKRILGAYYVHKIKNKRFFGRLFQHFLPHKKKTKKTAPCIVDKYTYWGDNFSVFNKLSHIGRYCSIGKNVQIGTSAHFTNGLTTSPIVILTFQFMGFPKITNNDWVNYYNNFFNIAPLAHQEPVSIGNDVWIGNNVVIMDGVRIGHGTIIGTGAVVTHDVPPYAVVVGVPAHVVKYRFDEKTIDKLLKLQWWYLNPDIISTLPFHDIDSCIKKIQGKRK